MDALAIIRQTIIICIHTISSNNFLLFIYLFNLYLHLFIYSYLQYIGDARNKKKIEALRLDKGTYLVPTTYVHVLCPCGRCFAPTYVLMKERK